MHIDEARKLANNIRNTALTIGTQVSSDLPPQANTYNETPYEAYTIEVDGVARSTTNSNGHKIAPTEEGLISFWRWFGDSKIVDAEGRPLVFYHGTHAVFNEFDNSMARDGAHFFSACKEHAGVFGPATAYFLALTNPLIISGSDLEDMVSDDDIDAGILPRDYIKHFLNLARSAGHDGLLVRGMGDLDRIEDVCLPLSPNSIRAASKCKPLYKENDSGVPPTLPAIPSRPKP